MLRREAYLGTLYYNQSVWSSVRVIDGESGRRKKGLTSVVGMDSDLDSTSDRPRDVRTLASASRTQSSLLIKGLGYDSPKSRQ
ncbi:MAG: hypothetical protein ACREYC_16645 [Gammaproteobacteria bacterium]